MSVRLFITKYAYNRQVRTWLKIKGTVLLSLAATFYNIVAISIGLEACASVLVWWYNYSERNFCNVISSIIIIQEALRRVDKGIYEFSRILVFFNVWLHKRGFLQIDNYEILKPCNFVTKFNSILTNQDPRYKVQLYRV